MQSPTTEHLQKQLLPSIRQLFTHDQWIFFQDSAPSHRSNLVQNFLQETLNKRFIKSSEWPPSSPDCNLMDYFFGDNVEKK